MEALCNDLGVASHEGQQISGERLVLAGKRHGMEEQPDMPKG
jgi:hypothetical protein